MTALEALHAWPFAVWLRSSPYAYPVVETLHILALAVVFGTILMVDIGILRARAQLRDWLVSLLPWTLLAFCVAAMTGLLMFLARASDLISNRMFVLKIVLLCIAGANAAALHARGPVDAHSGVTRAQAVLSIVIWVAIVICGRWIAYV
jgi:hypothetical protein